MKTCADCQKTLPFDAFRMRASNKDGYEIRCKNCRNIRYNKADPRKVFRKIYERQIHHSIDRGHAPPNYALKQLIDWADQQPQLHDIWNAYVASGYQTKLRPSCDRLNNDLPYTLNNLEIVTWEENVKRAQRDKQAGTLKSGPGGQRPVIAYNKDGSFHREYVSIMEAVRDVNGRMWGIASVANGTPVKDGRGALYTPKTYKGFTWKWK